jgi:hypothetical protein
MRRSWVVVEPGLTELRAHARRLAARARRRPWLVLAATTALTALALLQAWRSRSGYHATIVVRVIERVDHETPATNWSLRDLRDLVHRIALSSAVLANVHGRFLAPPGAPSPTDPERVAKLLREDVELEILPNNSLLLAQGEYRSAHVTIGFEARTIAQARGVVLGIAQPIIDWGQARRRQDAEAAATWAGAVNAEAHAEMWRMLARSGGDVRGAVPSIEEALGQGARLDRAAVRAEEAERVRRSERAMPGLEAVVVDELLGVPLPRRTVVILTGIFALLLGLPLAVATVAAFDRRVFTTEDLRHLGLDVVGRLP